MGVPGPVMGGGVREERASSRLRAAWREHLRPLLGVIVVLLAVRSSVADWYDVPTGSMNPTIIEGDRITVNKAAYDLRVPFLGHRLATWADPARGDIVIFPSPANGTRLVKRVVAVPGDTVELRSHRLFINEVAAGYGVLDRGTVAQIPEPARGGYRFAEEEVAGAAHPVMLTPRRPVMSSFPRVTVPAGRYFVMGDNRDNSADSRVFGFVERAAIVGRAGRVAFSLDRENWWLPRAGRFLRRLP